MARLKEALEAESSKNDSSMAESTTADTSAVAEEEKPAEKEEEKAKDEKPAEEGKGFCVGPNYIKFSIVCYGVCSQ